MKCPKCHSENTEGARFCSSCAAPLTDAKDDPKIPERANHSPENQAQEYLRDV